MAIAQPREDRRSAGVLLMVGAVFWFTCIDTAAKWLLIAGLPALQVVFARYAGHFVAALVLYGSREGLGAFRSNAPKRQLFRSCCLMGSTTLNFTALQFLPITVTTTILFAVPVVVTLLAIPILKEVVGLRRLIAVCVAFLGVVVVMQPWGSGFHPAMILSLGALTLAATYFVMTRMLAGIERDSTHQLWSAGMPTLALLPFVIPIWVWPQGSAWLVFCLIGLFGISGHVAVTNAHRWADASLLSPVLYIQIFFAAASGILVFDTWPTIWTLSGGLIIIGSGLYIWQRERALRNV